MGAALLEKPELIKDILSTLVRNINKPITCKIRLKSEISKTIDLMKIAESTGIRAIAVHARYVADRPKDKAHWDLLKEIIDLKPVNIPIIANGDIFEYEDIQKIKEYTGASSVMIARGACRNPSIFSSIGISVKEMMKEYTKVCIDTDNPFSNTKYTLMCMSKEQGKWLSESKEGVDFHKSKTYDEICKLWDIEEYLKNSRLKKPKTEPQIKLEEICEGTALSSKKTTNDFIPESKNEPILKKQKFDSDNSTC